MMATFDPLHTTALELSHALAAGTLTSQDIVRQYLAQISAHNHAGLRLNAIASLPPESLLLETAKRLDGERARGQVRGPLHGVPIILKDAIITAPELGMGTTVGAVGFEHVRARRSAGVVERLIDQGMIILGKATLTEFCGHKGTLIPPGWSAMYGQGQSPYIKGGVREDDFFAGHSSPGGSSSGSAIGIAAGFSPLSLGTETAGSLVLPANRAGLYAVKLTKADVDMTGVFTISRSFDSMGPMAKTPADLALVIEAMVTPESAGRRNGSGLTSALNRGWDTLRIGFVDPDVWRPLDFPDRPVDDCDSQIREDYITAKDRIVGLANAVVFPVSPIHASGLQFRDTDINPYIALREFPESFAAFAANFDECSIKSLEDLIAWNDRHADRAMPEPNRNQDDIRTSLQMVENPEKAREEISEAWDFLASLRPTLQDTLTDHAIDVLVAPSDSNLCILAAVFGHPIGVVPHTYLPIGQPQGLTIVANKHREDLLLQFMSNFEKTFGPRKVPPLLDERADHKQ